MASLKDMRNRIASVKATRKITKAMQMVAAAKLRRAQEAATAARPYAERMDSVLANLASKVADKNSAPPLLVGNGKTQIHLLIVMTAERGLCGGFNSNVIKAALELGLRLARERKPLETRVREPGRRNPENAAAASGEATAYSGSSTTATTGRSHAARAAQRPAAARAAKSGRARSRRGAGRPRRKNVGY